jgi:hypothetical protein
VEKGSDFQSVWRGKAGHHFFRKWSFSLDSLRKAEVVFTLLRSSRAFLINQLKMKALKKFIYF